MRSGFLRIGLHPGGGHFTLAGRAAGWSTAAAMALFSCDVDGDRAVSLGLAWQAVDDEQVEAAAIERAHVAARDPALSRLATRHLRLEASAPLSVAAATELERAAQLWSFRR